MPMIAYAKLFYEIFCKNCNLDQNKETDPDCEYLKKMMEGENPPRECGGRRKENVKIL
jgi:hypothetical protein